VKVSKIRSKLVEDITALGGNLVEFLTKEVTHVISEGPEWKFLVLSSGKCGPPSPWTPGATSSPSTSLDGDRRQKVRSRVESIVGNTKPESIPGGDVIDTAKKLGCQIWSLNKTLAWLDKFKAKYGKICSFSSSQSRQQHANNTPCSSAANRSSLPRPKQQGLAEPYIKLDSTLRHARPSFLELKAWPKLNFDGYSGTSPFSDQRKSLKHRNRLNLGGDNRVESLRAKEELRKKECAKKKVSGFCENCNVNFSELERHLRGEVHQKFVRNSANWKELDANTELHNLQTNSSILF
jgi:hypothetical protein